MDNRTIKDLTKLSLSFLTPFYEQGRGNATTARRIVTGLGERNLTTNVVAYDEKLVTPNRMDESDLFHILHFRRFAEWQEKNMYKIQKPYVITSGGTDVNIDIFKDEFKEMIGNVLKDAAAITVFSIDAKEKLANIYPAISDKVHIIKQSVWFPAGASCASSIFHFHAVGPNILLPAGLRAVKDVLFVLPALRKLKEQFPNLMFTILGAPIEARVLDAVRQVQKDYSWFHYFEEVPLKGMKQIYKQSDLIINTSLSEGQSSALLEAMSVGKPVVARNNGGNRSIIRHGETGLLFDTIDDFYGQVVELLKNEELKKKLAQNGQKYVEENHSLQEEIDSYLRLYKHVMNTQTIQNSKMGKGI